MNIAHHPPILYDDALSIVSKEEGPPKQDFGYRQCSSENFFSQGHWKNMDRTSSYAEVILFKRRIMCKVRGYDVPRIMLVFRRDYVNLEDKV